jgi:hypothetical protein
MIRLPMPPGLGALAKPAWTPNWPVGWTISRSAAKRLAAPTGLSRLMGGLEKEVEIEGQRYWLKPIQNGKGGWTWWLRSATVPTVPEGLPYYPAEPSVHYAPPSEIRPAA